MKNCLKLLIIKSLQNENNYYYVRIINFLPVHPTYPWEKNNDMR